MPTPRRATSAKSLLQRKTPRALGYSFPAEWSRQRGVWLSWPRPEGISFPGRYHTIGPGLAAIVREIALREEVHINVPNENWEHIVRRELALFGGPDERSMRRVFFHFVKTNECWCRDHGPAFVTRMHRGKRQLAVVDWGFNAWGGKYPPYGDDDDVPTRVAEEFGLPLFKPGIVMEGGAVEFNGKGTVLTTEQCLLHKNRNPGLSKARIERYLKDYYGQSHVCWLGDGIEGDDTDGHIDDLARFLDPKTIVVGVEDDPRDANYKVLQENLWRARLLKDQDGRTFDIVTVPMPGVVEIDSQRLPATYLNFLFINGALLVPTFGHRNDRVALEILQKHMDARQSAGGRRQVVGIDCRDLIWGLGAIHCLTQQMPRA
ncbi:MAG: agmatine/peptidylarginine deiminase [Phycisphaerales bacterium]